MTARALVASAVTVLLVSCLAFAARAADEQPLTKETLELSLSLKLDEAGKASLFLDMPVGKDFLQSLTDGRTKHLVATVTFANGVTRQDKVKAYDLLRQLGVEVKLAQ